MSEPSRQLQTVRQKSENLRSILEARKGELARALPRHIRADRLLRVTLTALQRNPKLVETTPASFYSCVLQCAQLGLEPDLLGQAYLIPYKNICTLIVGYKGLMILARRSGEISTMEARVVREKDEFYYEFGLEPKLVHRPNLDAEGDLTHVYAIARLRDGGLQWEVMTKAEVEQHRERSPSVKAKRSSPWDTDYEAMALKTVLRKLCKLLPSDVELQTAVALDEQAEAGVPQDLPIVDLEVEPEPERDPDTGEAVPPPKDAA